MLSVAGLKAGYDGKVVVDVPHLQLSQGEHCLITGNSGSGKTTLLYALGGLLSPINGSISLAGTDMTALGTAERDAFRGKNIGIIYQTLHMVGALSVLQNLLLAQYAAALPQTPEKALQLLGQLGIADKKDAKPEQLSQGQQQRAAIARAAMNSPKVILGDEPTSALDDIACEAVMQLLLGVAKASGASLIVATHDARITKHFAKHVALGV